MTEPQAESTDHTSRYKSHRKQVEKGISPLGQLLENLIQPQGKAPSSNPRPILGHGSAGAPTAARERRAALGLQDHSVYPSDFLSSPSTPTRTKVQGRPLPGSRVFVSFAQAAL